MYGFILRTALHIACKIDKVSAAKALLRHSADTCQPKKQCNQFVPPTPLKFVSDRSELLELLFEPTRKLEVN